MNFNLQVHGCQMNHSDAERIKSILKSLGQKEEQDVNKADLIIFVTCSIKQKAEDKVIGHFHELKKIKIRRPNLQIGITGCMARITSNKHSNKKDKLLKSLKDLDFVFKIDDVSELPKLLENEMVYEPNDQTPASYFEVAPTYGSSFQAYVPIMNGCNKFCTYCIVPYSRGREISRPMSAIISEIETLVKKGYKEITLLGQNVNSYGRTNNVYDKSIKQNGAEPFAQLLHEVNKTGIKRVRFTSPHPQDMNDEVIKAICTLPCMCDHVHLPLQAGDDEILKRMNRSYDTKKFRSIVKKFRSFKPNISISTDIIVGFCGETKKQFQNTVDIFKEMEFDLAYISQYSQREGTYAEKNLKDNISKEEKKRRFHVLNDELKKISLKKNLTYIGKEVDVLIDQMDRKGNALGKTSCYRTVVFPKDAKIKLGDQVSAKIASAKEWTLETK